MVLTKGTLTRSTTGFYPRVWTHGLVHKAHGRDRSCEARVAAAVVASAAAAAAEASTQVE